MSCGGLFFRLEHFAYRYRAARVSFESKRTLWRQSARFPKPDSFSRYPIETNDRPRGAEEIN